MTASNKLTDKEQVDQFIQKLEPAPAAAVNAIRLLILNCSNEIGERIKWNNPSFYFTGAMKTFDPKEYKRDIAVFNLHQGRIMLVLPTGANIKNANSLLEGNYKDGRRMISFKNVDDIAAKATALQQAIQEWISVVDR